MLQLLQPAWAWLSAGIIVPVMLHLWNTRKGKVLQVGSINLLRESSARRSMTIRLTEWLLLLLRCLLIIVLALLIAQPNWLNKLHTGNNKGWILIDKNDVGKVYPHFKKQIDSLLLKGFQLHAFNKGFDEIALKDSSAVKATYLSNDYWGLLQSLNAVLPVATPVYIYSRNKLSDFKDGRATTDLKVRWNTFDEEIDSNFIVAAYNTFGDSVRIISQHSSNKQTIFKAATISAKDYADNYAGIKADTEVLHVSIFGNSDAKYVQAAFDAISMFTGRKIAVRIIENKAAVPAETDWLFWLSEEPIPYKVQAKNVFKYAPGKGINTKSIINLQEDVAITLNKRISTANTSGQAVWKDGFGDPLLEKISKSNRNIYNFYSRLNPSWNQLIWDEVFPAALAKIILQPVTEMQKNDVRAIDEQQLQPQFAAAIKDFVAKTSFKDLSKLFWILLLLLFIAERWFSVFAISKKHMLKDSQHIIKVFRKRWQVLALLKRILIAGGIAVAFLLLAHKLFSMALVMCVMVAIIVSIILFFLLPASVIRENDVVSYFDKYYPQLSESSGLLLKQDKELNVLQRLQRDKTIYALQQSNVLTRLTKKTRSVVIVATSMFVTCLLISFLPARTNQRNTRNQTNKVSLIPGPVAGIRSVMVTIQTPAYTRIKKFTQTLLDIKAPENSLINWQIFTDNIKSISLLFSDSVSLPLKLKSGSVNTWVANKQVIKSGFYQLVINSKLHDELYRVEVVHDQAPTVQLIAPASKISFDIAEPKMVKVAADVRDDYGIADASLVTTISSGSGEAVKFKEQVFRFPVSFSAQNTQYHLIQTLNLAALQMQPGDELYGFIKTTDNNKQTKQSDVFVVSIEDTSNYTQGEGLIGSIKLKGDALRSQRQIIIETEQLIKDMPIVTTEKFKDKSNNLGLDQRALRLEFGQYLGEEDESGESQPQDDNAPAYKIENFGNANAVLDQFTDKHDNAEDASIFDAETKTQLKTMLTNMWNAELRLRTFKPKEALPFEYKALGLFKELQQKSRVYVAKTSYKTTPLDPRKRLSGDLSKIFSIGQHANTSIKKDDIENLRSAITLLQQLQEGRQINNPQMLLLQQINLQLSKMALSQPAMYLPAVAATRALLASVQNKKPVERNNALTIQAVLQQLLKTASALPSGEYQQPDRGLSSLYFKNLSRR